jgi:hypothetical protein
MSFEARVGGKPSELSPSVKLRRALRRSKRSFSSSEAIALDPTPSARDAGAPEVPSLAL